MNLEWILAEWKKDSVFDEMNLDTSALEGAKLHAKYLELHSTAKLQLKRREAEFNVLLKQKYLHFSGKLTKDEIDELGWDYDPFNGLKILKGDFNMFLEADKDIQASQARVEYLKTVIDTLKEILDNVRWRHQTIRNAIEWRKFTSGV